MKTLKKASFPVLLILTCVTAHFWQHALASLPYLPNNGIEPLGVMTPLLLLLTFFTTFAMLKNSETKNPVRRSLLSTAAMLLIFLAAGVYFLSYLTYRFAAPLPVFIILPDWPTGIASMVITLLCLCHLTGLLITRFVKEKPDKKRVIAAALGWLLLNACLFIITT